MSEDVKLHSTMDANVWAKEFMRINPTPDLDTMRSWFANLIMCGWDHAHWKCEKELAKWKSRYEELKLENKRIREDGFKAGSQQAYDIQVREWKALGGELLVALKAQMKMRNSTRPTKLNEALSWRDNDDLADKIATEVLAKARSAGLV